MDQFKGFSVAFGEILTAPVPFKSECLYTCTISHVMTPSRFFVKLEKNTLLELETEMSNLLQIIYGPLLEEEKVTDEDETKRFRMVSVAIFDVIMGGLGDDERKLFVDDLRKIFGDYAVVFVGVDQLFFRVSIVEFKPETLSCVCYKLDDGRLLRVPLHQLLPMSRSLLEYPCFAIPCHLHETYPLGSEVGQPMPNWSADSISEFKFILKTNEQWYMKTFPRNGAHPPASFPVVLDKMFAGDSVNQIMTRKKKALHMPEPPLPTPKVAEFLKAGPKTIKRLAVAAASTESDDTAMKPLEGNLPDEDKIGEFNPMRDQYYSGRNQYGINPDSPALAIYGYAAQNEEKHCRFFTRNGSCHKGNACRFKHVVPNPSGFPTDQVPAYVAPFCKLPLLSVNAECRISSIEVSEDVFYCVLVRDLQSFETDFTKMLDLLNDEQNLRKLQRLLLAPAMTELVIVRIWEKFHRGQCLETDPEGDIFQILLVDSGHVVDVGLDSLRVMEPDYLHVPLMARRFRLVGVQPTSSNAAMMAGLLRLVQNDPNLKIVVRANHEVVQYWVDLFDNHGRNLGEVLVVQGLARRVEDLIPNPGLTIYPG